MKEDSIELTDCKTPACIAHHVSNKIMLPKTRSAFYILFILGFLAGIYVGFGGEIATVVLQESSQILGSGFSKLISGISFTVALILIIIAGGELFTGNTLILMSVLEKKTTIKLLLRNWIIVYFSNLTGAIFIIFLLFLTGLWTSNNFGAAAISLKIAALKVNLSFIEAFTRGILANWLVCLAIWISVASKQLVGKIFAVVFPIATFAACGYEHCIANMYFIPKGLILKTIPDIVNSSGVNPVLLKNLTVQGFIFNNLIPVTIGNILGAVLFVAFLYWYVYLKDKPPVLDENH